MSLTQRQMLEQVLLHHTCSPVRALAGGWVQWSTGDLLATPNNWFYVGPMGFRFGAKRTTSRDYPKLKARLLAEWPDTITI